jgi:hypothetical protein
MGAPCGEADFVASQSTADRHEFSTGGQSAEDHLETLMKLQLGLPELSYPPTFAGTIQITCGGNSIHKLNLSCQIRSPLRQVENGRYDFQIISFQDLWEAR